MNRTLGYDARQQRGKIPRCVIVEEAALVDRDIYDRVLQPMFATHDEYERWLIPTLRARVAISTISMSTQTTGLASRTRQRITPWIFTEWFEEMRADVDTIIWGQEYLGEFVEAGDVYLPRSLVAPCIADQQPQHTPSAYDKLVRDVATQLQTVDTTREANA